jgi:hypothetical protein
MQYDADASGAVQLTLTDHEANQLEKFLHLAAMSLQTWPLCVGTYMSHRKKWHEAQKGAPVDDG